MKQVTRLIYLYVFYICTLSAASSLAYTVQGEIYSESTYVPQYGLLTESHVRIIPKVFGPFIPYLGAATQIQNKTRDSQDRLYAKNYVMAVAGFRYHLLPQIALLAEARTEERGRYGVFAGHLWEYQVQSQNIITDVYAESIVYPSFHNDPVSTLWVKQGLRFRPATHWILDPFIEGYIRKSPTADLGRDTEQLRAGLRTYYIVNAWTFGLLAYQSFPKDEASHEEALIVIGGRF